MMRHTASLQINLDLGPEDVWKERWLLSNLVSPLMTATFASSPGLGAVCSRARAWQELDPTRSGFPRLLVEGPGDDPRAEWGQAAIEADVMIYRVTDDHFEPGCPGCAASRNGSRTGIPGGAGRRWTISTTTSRHCFFEVRPRGFLELRAGEALPDRWRAASVVLTAALLYEDGAREKALDLAVPAIGSELPDLWRRAAIDGVRDPEIRDLACASGGSGSRVHGRCPPGFSAMLPWRQPKPISSTSPAVAGCPRDDLLDLIADDPARALAWASS